MLWEFVRSCGKFWEVVGRRVNLGEVVGRCWKLWKVVEVV